MENCFVNTYVRDRKRVEDLYRWYLYRRKVMCAMRIIYMACFVLSSACAFFQKDFSRGIIFLTVVVLAELFQFIRYRRVVKLTLQRDAENNMGQPVQLTTIVKENIIRQENAAGQGNDVPLSQMKWAIQTRKMVIICTKAKLLYVLPNDAFTQGTPEELIVYLRSKGIGA